MQENQPAAQIPAKHSIFFQMAPLYVMNLIGADGNRSRDLSPGRRDSHNTTDARQLPMLHVYTMLPAYQGIF